MVINYKNWVWVALVPRAFLFSWGGATHEKGEALGTRLVVCGLYVNKMADATLSSKDEEIKKKEIKTAVSTGASLVELKKASISLIGCN